LFETLRLRRLQLRSTGKFVRYVNVEVDFRILCEAIRERGPHSQRHHLLNITLPLASSSEESSEPDAGAARQLSLNLHLVASVLHLRGDEEITAQPLIDQQVL
jgi:hypothetical protein